MKRKFEFKEDGIQNLACNVRLQHAPEESWIATIPHAIHLEGTAWILYCSARPLTHHPLPPRATVVVRFLNVYCRLRLYVCALRLTDLSTREETVCWESSFVARGKHLGRTSTRFVRCTPHESHANNGTLYIFSNRPQNCTLGRNEEYLTYKYNDSIHHRHTSSFDSGKTQEDEALLHRHLRDDWTYTSPSSSRSSQAASWQ